MRMVVMLLLGLFVGAFGAVTAVSALRQETPLSKSVMTVSGHHFSQLRKLNQGGRCESPAIEPHLRTMRAVATDIDTAFLPTGGDDTAFRGYAGEYRQALDAALLSVAGSCPTLEATLRAVGAKCKACHRDFRH